MLLRRPLRGTECSLSRSTIPTQAYWKEKGRKGRGGDGEGDGREEKGR